MNRLTAWVVGVLGLAAFAAPTTASAQEQDKVLVVPYSQKNVELPHPAHEAAQITLKAIVQNATCGTYQVWWDVNRNGNYDDDWSRVVSREGTTFNVQDIGRTFLVPSVDRDQSFNINLRVRNRCTNQDKFGTFRLFVYDWAPSANPTQWTEEQVEIMATMAVQESLWYTHRQQTGFSGRNASTIYSSSPYFDATNLSLWQFTTNGHLPAYPPNTINAHGVNLPNGWAAENDRRWAADPYAETVIRHINNITRYYYRNGINRADESNQHGYRWDGARYVANTLNRLPNTSDGYGVAAYGNNNTYRVGMNLGALATALPSLAGTPLQNGPAGWLWERYIQELTDWMGYMQIDGGCSTGGWYYTAFDGGGDCVYGDFSTTQWAFVGLESVAVVGEPYGVFVNNRHKYRVAYQILSNQQTDGGAAYDNRVGGGGRGSDFKMTGGAILAHRMIGTHNMPRDARVPFPNEATVIPDNYADRTNGYGRGQALTRTALVDSYNRHLAYAATWFARRRVFGSHWLDGNWQNGDYLCGNQNTVYNGGRCGNTYTTYSNQKGYATGLPELTRVGPYDWRRMYTIYYMRAQDRAMNVNDPMSGYSLFGRVIDDYCETTSVTCHWGSGHLGSAMGGLVMTPTVFNPKPVPLGTVQPNRVTEGCSGGNAGRVTFDHSASFHPDAGATIDAFQWDVDASNGLWWDNNGQPDFETDDSATPFEYQYLRRGNYTATLRVVDSAGQTKTTTVQVTVDAAANVPPAVAHGGPYVVEEGQGVQLAANATDQNLGCGDRLTVSWELDGDNDFNDAAGASPNVGWALLAGLPRGAGNPNRIFVRARDTAGAVVTAETTLTIYPSEPVASGRANPNPAACRAEVTFDGSASAHPNPARSIAQYDWDVDNDGNFDGSGQIFRFAYQQFGQYTARLRVTDDLGRTDETTFVVDISQGNQPPVARVARNAITVLEGDALALDGRGSSEPNANCGDSIVTYAWDLNGNGAFGDAADIPNTPNPTVAWNALIAAGLRLADPVTGLPTNRVTLRVTDEFGVSATVDVTVTLYEALPEVVVVQNPNPASVRLDNGLMQVTLDGRESSSPVPNVSIVRYDWDLDNDGTFETADRPVTDFQRVVPENQRQPGALPTFTVRLRVTDETGRQNIGSYDIVLTVPPTPPTADADPSDPPERGYDILVGEDLTLDGGQSSDPDSAQAGDYLRFFRWDLTYDANDGFQADLTRQAANAQEQANAARATVTWAELNAAGINGPGTYTVRLQVQDITNLTSEDSATLRVHAVDPVALVDANPNPAACGGRVTFDASASNHPHPTIDIVGYAWDFDGDGQVDANGQSVQRAFDAFTFGQANTVALTVTDSRGNEGTTAIDVNVDQGNRAPVPNAGGFRDVNGQVAGPYVIVAGEGVQLNSAGSSDPDAACGDSIQSFAWDIGANGAVNANGAQANLTWAQLQAAGVAGVGNYDVRLTVTDRFGVSANGLATLRVVAGPRAVATANPARTGCGNQVEFSAARSEFFGPANQGFGIVSYAWDLDNDGVYDDAQGPVVQRAAVAQPDANGQIQVVAGLQITDGLNHTDTTQVVVVIDVQNQPPVANAGGPYTTGPVQGGFADVTLDGRGSLDPNAPCDAVVVYKWDTDADGRYGRDDNPADLEGATVRYNNANWRVNTVDTVRLVVCDQTGACSAPGEAQVEVLDVAPPVGEMLSPRADAANTCLGAGNFTVDLSVSDPAGNPLTATVTIAGIEVGQGAIDPPDNGNAVPLQVVVNSANVPEGRHEVVVTLRNSQNAESEVTSGGRLTFDRTAPVVSIQNNLAEGVCYNPNAVPEAVVNAVDAQDNAPALNRETIEDGCGRTLRATATDACGNVGSAERTYLLAQPVEVQINGVDEGALVAQARVSWEVIGPAACASNVTARYSRNGGAAANYPESQLLNQPGNYAMTVAVANCSGVARNQIRNFSVNSAPTAVAIPAGHPNADPNLPNAYVVTEGAGLQLDGSESLAPEAGDNVARYQWDYDSDGNFDAEGGVVAFDTNEDGVFQGVLRVTDSLGATGQTLFRVTVLDVDPSADAGGPYVVAQGTPLQFDARATQPGSAADLITRYTWDFGDGTPPVNGAGLTQPEHTYEDNGAYTVTLRVDDEDSFVTVQVAVAVRDVDPIIDGINPPADPYETAPMTFTIDARPGAASDPITRIEWDMDGDGVPEYSGNNLTEVEHQFDAAGDYNVVVTVRDGDSSSVDAIVVNVREITLRELLAWTQDKVEADLADPGFPAFARFQLAPIGAALDRGLWGEDNDERGVTLMALRTIVAQLVQAQGAGADYGWELWALSRQLQREMTRMRAAILADGDDPRDANHPSIQLATDHLDNVAALYDAPGFRADLNTNDRVGVANDIFFEAVEAYYWLADSTYQCNDFNDFTLPNLADPLAIRPEANRINTDELGVALTAMRNELDGYAQKAGAPAAANVAAAVDKMDNILALQGLLLGPNCEENERCVTDREALDLELEAAQLVRDLDVAANSGAWVRQWQSCLVLALKFRIELSIQRVEFACGARTAIAQRARQVQAVGLEFVDDDQDAQALSYYAHPDRQCTLIQVYDQCLVSADPEANAPYDGDVECLNELVCRELAPTVTGGLCPVGDEANCMWPAVANDSMALVATMRNASRGPCDAADLSLALRQAPQGWMVDIMPGVDAAPGEAVQVPVTVSWPAGTAAGDYRIDVFTRQTNDATLGREFSFTVRVP